MFKIIRCGELSSKFINQVNNFSLEEQKVLIEKINQRYYALQDSILSEGYVPDKYNNWIEIKPLAKKWKLKYPQYNDEKYYQIQNGHRRHKILYDNFGEDYMIKALIVRY